MSFHPNLSVLQSLARYGLRGVVLRGLCQVDHESDVRVLAKDVVPRESFRRSQVAVQTLPQRDFHRQEEAIYHLTDLREGQPLCCPCHGHEDSGSKRAKQTQVTAEEDADTDTRLVCRHLQSSAFPHIR